MRKNILRLAVLLAAALFFASPVFAQKGPGPKGDRHRMGPTEFGCEDHPGGLFFGAADMMKKKLGLSDDQVKSVGKINLEYKKKFLDFQEKMSPRHIKLRKLLLEDNVDLKEVRALIKEISDLRVEVQMLRIQHRLDIEKVLTPDQKIKLKNMPPPEMKGLGKMNCPRGDMKP